MPVVELIPLPPISPLKNDWSCTGGIKIAVGLMLNFSDDSPSVICANTPISVPLGAISKMMFLLGSDRSTLLTNIAGVPLKRPSESNVMLYQLTSPVARPQPVGGRVSGCIAGIDLADHRVEIEEDARLAGRGFDAVDHARVIDRADDVLSPPPREIA